MVIPKNIITPEQVHKENLTVGQLLDFIEENNLPRDAKVLFERIEDVYFEKNNWSVVLKEGWNYHLQIQYNKRIDDGEFDDVEEYPLLKGERPEKFPEDKLEELKNQYVPLWSPVKFKDDDNLYLDAHY